MCTFLTIGIHRERSESLEQRLLGLGLEVHREVNPGVAALFDADDVLFMVTRGGCSCDLVPPRAQDRGAKLRRRGLKKGQIARALVAPRRPSPSDPLFEVLREHAPVSLFFHQVSGAPLTQAVKSGSLVETLDID